MRDKILILDFDGVIINGIEEYWFTCCRAYDTLFQLPLNFSYKKFKKKVPQKFIQFRPSVTKGWEMLLLAYIIIHSDNNWDCDLLSNFENNFHLTCKSIAIKENFEEKYLQNLLDKTRDKVIKENLDNWVSKHKLFDGIRDLLNELALRKIDFMIISSKNSKFLKHICPIFKLYPKKIFGYDNGTKISIIKKLNKKYQIIGFVEDRREALEEVIKDNETDGIPCFFADWGYNLESDKINLNEKITILTLKTLKNLYSIFD